MGPRDVWTWVVQCVTTIKWRFSTSMDISFQQCLWAVLIVVQQCGSNFSWEQMFFANKNSPCSGMQLPHPQSPVNCVCTGYAYVGVCINLYVFECTSECVCVPIHTCAQ